MTGIIPARAGSTEGICIDHPRLRDHPRSCGEHEDFTLEPHSVRGSSPLVRGAPDRHVGIIASRGIIPARAGSTTVTISRPDWGEDHPRSCGEHPSENAHLTCVVGSSPLVRGALVG